MLREFLRRARAVLARRMPMWRRGSWVRLVSASPVETERSYTEWLAETSAALRQPGGPAQASREFFPLSLHLDCMAQSAGTNASWTHLVKAVGTGGPDRIMVLGVRPPGWAGGSSAPSIPPSQASASARRSASWIPSRT